MDHRITYDGNRHYSSSAVYTKDTSEVRSGVWHKAEVSLSSKGIIYAVDGVQLAKVVDSKIVRPAG